MKSLVDMMAGQDAVAVHVVAAGQDPAQEVDDTNACLQKGQRGIKPPLILFTSEVL